MKHSTLKSDFEYKKRMVENVAVYKLIAYKLTCKGNL